MLIKFCSSIPVGSPSGRLETQGVVIVSVRYCDDMGELEDKAALGDDAVVVSGVAVSDDTNGWLRFEDVQDLLDTGWLRSDGVLDLVRSGLGKMVGKRDSKAENISVSSEKSMIIMTLIISVKPNGPFPVQTSFFSNS